MLEKLRTPMSWQAYCILYLFVSAFDIMIWPVIWCTRALPFFGGIHVMVEGMGVSRLIFNDSKNLQPFWLLLSITYLVLSLALSESDALFMFKLGFSVTDSGSLWIGLYTYLASSRPVPVMVGLFFLIHGVTSAFLPPILGIGNIFNSDQLAHFFLIFLAGAAQVYVVAPLYKREAITNRNDPATMITYGKDGGDGEERRSTRLALLIIWAIMGSVGFFIITTITKVDASLPCGTYPIVYLLSEIIFPAEGTIGIFFPLYFYKQMQLEKSTTQLPTTQSSLQNTQLTIQSITQSSTQATTRPLSAHSSSTQSSIQSSVQISEKKDVDRTEEKKNDVEKIEEKKKQYSSSAYLSIMSALRSNRQTDKQTNKQIGVGPSDVKLDVKTKK